MATKRLLTINVQRLFAIVLAIKIISSIASVFIGDPWILGLAVPIAMMILYMAVGYHSRGDDVSLERFADSCYYMGFIFTITSIVVSLFDLPNLGSGEGMRNIALRFGAAMVSTVLGMGVRVYLVSFRKDADDAIRDAEDAVLDATRMFITQLDSVMGSLRQFEQQVTEAAKLTVENVNRQVEALGTQYAQSLNDFYLKLNDENKAAFSALIDEIKLATARLADSVDTYSRGIQGNLENIESKVTEFANAVTNRLAATTFPDDFFARELQGPLELLKGEAAVLGKSVRTVSSGIEASTGALAKVLASITTKTKNAADAMDAVVALSQQHHNIVINADLQLKSLVSLATQLEKLDLSLQLAASTVGNNSNVAMELLAKVTLMSSENAGLRSEIKDAMTALTGKLDANAMLASGVVKKLETQAAELHSSAANVINKIESHAESSGLVAQRISEASAITKDAVLELKILGASNTQVASGAQEAANAASAAIKLVGEIAKSNTDAVESFQRATHQVAVAAERLQTLDMSLSTQKDNICVLEKPHSLQEHQVLVETNAVLSEIAGHAATPEVASLLQQVSAIGEAHVDTDPVARHTAESASAPLEASNPSSP
jgi:hypothetical protein